MESNVADKMMCVEVFSHASQQEYAVKQVLFYLFKTSKILFLILKDAGS